LFQKQALSTDAAIVQRVIKENAPSVKPAKMWGEAVLNFECLVLSWGNWGLFYLTPLEIPADCGIFGEKKF